MNVRRIFVFALLLFLATASAGFVFGAIGGFLRATGHDIPSWMPVGQAIGVLVAAVAVIAALAKRQSDRTWEHAFAAAASAWALSFPISVLLAGQPIKQWVAGALVILVIVPPGVLIGRRLRSG